MKQGLVAGALLALTVAATLAASGCGPDPRQRAKLSILQKELFTPSCSQAVCHGGAAPVQQLDLREGKAYASLVNVDARLQENTKRVLPGDPEASLLYQVLTGTSESVQRMPPGLKIPDEDIEAVRIWIENGAADD